MKVKRDNLLLIAGIVWLVAGANILTIGVTAYLGSSDLAWWALLLMSLGTILVLAIFHAMFGRLVKKHVTRIRGFEDKRHNPLLFFDLRSYLVMAFMIAFGVTLRMSGVVPNWLIASFYTGLGTALMLAGTGFILHRLHGAGWSFHKRAPYRA